MSGKTLTAVLLLAAGVGAYHYATKVDPLDRLLAVPESASAASDRRGGIVEADPLPPLADAVEPDHHTVFIFYSTQCPACVQLLSQLGPFVRLRPDVAVRRVNLGPQWSSEDAQVKYGINIRSVPHVMWELKHLVRQYRPEYVEFIDDTFMTFPK